MSIREQFAGAGPAFTTNGHAAIQFTTAAPVGATSSGYHALKREVHETVLDRVELERLARYPQEQVKQEIATLVNLIVDEQRVLLNDNERRQLTVEIYDEMFGFGPLEPLLKDPTVSDILVNTGRKTYVERRGKLELTDVVFYDDAHLMKVIEKIVSRVPPHRRDQPDGGCAPAGRFARQRHHSAISHRRSPAVDSPLFRQSAPGFRPRGTAQPDAADGAAAAGLVQS